jgi:alpha/beta superfamily hydrolase
MVAVTRHTESLALDGPAGVIDCLIDWPAGGSAQVLPSGASGGLALIGHPHPLYGGTRDNKVAATLARAFAALGWVSVRPNFRGVGHSQGVHDHGYGETADFVFLSQILPQVPLLTARLGQHPALALAGFSFGSFVAAQAAKQLTQDGNAAACLVLVGTAAGKWPVPAVPASTLVIHGEHDTTIPLGPVLTWASASGVPVTVLPGADHFFHRRLTTLKTLIQRHVLGQAGLGWPQPLSSDESPEHE